ncbi:hypothetical protein BX616_009928 [Lobosporangium transversale]|uniref:Tyr recombinase domain-containing protein n=1 Tax=Lobosporangium transversale TaxID=64571 RepID=A0A1Y2GBQ5_9FUNG|nr:hypothetical protein BCR41DRAFT_425145 [Lobosporangium transversale]KAF9918210.1 hypothetical protein BX616_009928 [Lobosporangium transversale]ORZ06312.1 hypothetical protein BCR41DRAFT_425145 [Lobosporangium transversale]|eukprot:XP_021877475.1 hypothetical protein BCR41DRAFT_425145 [Lobosporangium transversale]
MDSTTVSESLSINIEAGINLRDALDAAKKTKTAHRYRFAVKTKTSYSGHLERGKKYALSMGGEYSAAFDELSGATPVVLLAFVAFKCDQSSLSYKTAEGIRSSFKQYFKDQFQCQGNFWRFENGRWLGNPVYDQAFEDYMVSLKKRDGRNGQSKQSLAMSYKDLTKLMEHLQEPDVIAKHGEGLCLFFQAFAATGFALWTRNEELLRLKGKDLDLGLKTDCGRSYFKITLTFRKTNQANAEKANIYEIHPLPEEPHACCYTKLQTWIKWLEKNSRALHPEDFVFPSLDNKGRVKLKEAFSHPKIQSLLDEFTDAANLLAERNGRYTTHCFRRGGAQHRFMFAKEKWSLKAVKWWGGWSEGEGVGTVMRYLLDEFVRYETGYGDMLSPVKNTSRHTRFMGESSPTELVTVQTMDTALDTLRIAIINDVNKTQQEMKKEVADLGAAITQQIQSLFQRSSPIVNPINIRHMAPLPSVVQPPQDDTEPPVAPRIPDIIHWREAVLQWEEGDPEKGLVLALRHWTPRMRATDPSRYSQRKLIATEFALLGRNLYNMKDTHGGALESVSNLIASIRAKNKQRIQEMKGTSASKKRQESEARETEEENEEEEPLTRRKHHKRT